MAVIAKDSGSTFTPAPPGTHNAVCVDVVDKDLQETAYGVKHKIQIVWEIDEENDQGHRYTVNKQYTLSLNEMSTLSKDLESWRGRKFTKEERDGFDIEKLIGAPCMINVQHNDSNGKVYANVMAVTPLPRGMEKLSPSPSYERQKDRDGGWDVRSPNSRLTTAGDTAPASSGDGAPAGPMMPDDNLPF